MTKRAHPTVHWSKMFGTIDLCTKIDGDAEVNPTDEGDAKLIKCRRCRAHFADTFVTARFNVLLNSSGGR